MPWVTPTYTPKAQASAIQKMDHNRALRMEMGWSALWACKSTHRQTTTMAMKARKCQMV